ncbi:DUF2690 domain-containing protein [Streptomyces longwoodensis]
MLLAALTLTVGSTAAEAATAAPQVAAGTCTFDSPVTARTASAAGVRIELRYSTSTRCAWGRITNANPGHLVWTQRSYDGGRTYEKLPTVEVRTGHDTHTDSYYDGGVLMRACGWDESAGASNCTGWY